MVLGKLTFISGGVRSGKSAYAENLLMNECGGRRVYIASGSNTDPEMALRIQKHRSDRSQNNWFTIEQPMNLEETLPLIEEGDLILWDCVTTWLTNELYINSEVDPCAFKEKEFQLYQTIDGWLKNASHLVIVSNEVLDELPSKYVEVQEFTKILGRIHRNLVKKSDTSIEMEYGIAQFWKGEVAL